MRSLFLSLLLLFGTVPAEAQHNIFIGGTAFPAAIPSANCPFGTSGLADNGCSGSQPLQAGSGAFLVSNGRATPATNGLNAISATPTDYSVGLPSRNTVGIDYPAGEYTPFTSLLPVTSGTIPAGCTIGSTGGVTGNTSRVTCTPTSSGIVLAGYDFTDGGSGHLSTCISLQISGDNGPMTVTDNYWFNNGYCVTAASTSGGIMIGVDLTRILSTTTLTFNTMDANQANFPYPYGACGPGSGLTAQVNCNPINPFYMQGDAHISYNAILGWTQRPVQYGAKTTTAMLHFDYNALVGCCSGTPLAHNEYFLVINGTNVTGGGQEDTGNLLMTSTFHQNSGEAPIPMGLPSPGTNPQVGPTPIYTVSDNVMIDSIAGGGNPTSSAGATVTGSVTGHVFTTSAISGNFMGSGHLVLCGAAIAGSRELTFSTIYNPAYSGVVSAGPAGGGNSGWANPPTNTILNQTSAWDFVFNSAIITAKLDNGGGGISGNILTVTIDNSIELTVGSKVSIAAGTFQVQSILSGTGGVGTYQMTASGLAATAAPVTVTPVDQNAGGFGVPPGTTLACASQTLTNGQAWGPEGGHVEGEAGNTTITGNYIDMSPAGASATIANNIQGSAATPFGGSISGSALTITQNIAATAVTAGGGGTYTSGTTTVAYTTDCLTPPVGTVNITSGSVSSITQTTKGIGCTTATAVINTTGPGTGATVSPTLAYPSIGKGFGLLIQSGIPIGTSIASGTAPNFVLQGASVPLGTVAPAVMNVIQSFCDQAVTWSPVTDPNVDMWGVISPTIMNSFSTSAVSGNGCGP